jgi:FKBP-type peptidyl-prolyl cis-trans isomerase SlpA
MQNITSKPPVVTVSACLTLHYRLVSAGGADIATTFNGNPATLMPEQGQLALLLEDCLIGLPEGRHKTFELTPAQGFGRAQSRSGAASHAQCWTAIRCLDI